MAEVADRGVWLGPESLAAHRADLAAFVERAVRLDAAAVIRLRARSPGQFTAWASTGLDVLASRVVGGVVRPDDLSVGADELGRGPGGCRSSGYVDPGLSDGLRVARCVTAGRGVHPSRRRAGPPDAGLGAARFAAGQGARQRARTTGVAAGSGGDPGQRGLGDSVGVPMRCVFALTAMGFLPQDADAVDSEEIVRVRVMRAWLRIDARFGSVYRRRGDPAVVLL